MGEEPGKEKLIEMYKNMLRSRMFEPAMAELINEGKASANWHSGYGHEGICAGVCAALRKDDYVVHSHRGVGHAIAKGLSIKKMIAEILGKKTGLLRGKGVGCFRWIAPEIGLMGQSGMLGGNQELAMGIGISIQMRKTDQVAVGFFGDGAANRGPMYEALNMASVWKLPVIFLCENNRYAWSMPLNKGHAERNISERAAGFGMVGVTVDGGDPIAVYKATLEAAERARKGKGPTLLECMAYRWEGHMITDPDEYRTDEQHEEARNNDPIEMYKVVLLDKGIITESEDKKMREEAQREIEEAVKFAESSPYPEPERAFEDLWA